MENVSKNHGQFMEEAKQRMEKLPVKGVCVIARLEGGEVYTDFYNCNVMDKMIFSGVIQQDVTRDIINAN